MNLSDCSKVCSITQRFIPGFCSHTKRQRRIGQKPYAAVFNQLENMHRSFNTILSRTWSRMQRSHLIINHPIFFTISQNSFNYLRIYIHKLVINKSVCRSLSVPFVYNRVHLHIAHKQYTDKV